MSDEFSWAEIKRQVYERAAGYCEYCQTTDRNTGQAMHTEHIDPFGGDELANLCLSCSSCNLSKARAIISIDPLTGNAIALFNPRQDLWTDHFEWVDGGLRLNGLTPTGRATIDRLKINQDRVVNARARWVIGGFHPP